MNLYERERQRGGEINACMRTVMLLLTFELVTWSAGTDSGTVCSVLRILADIVGQPGSLPQTPWPFDDASTPPTPATRRKTMSRD